MPIVGGLDIHRRQITFDYLDLRTGDAQRGVIRPATREAFRAWLVPFGRKRGSFALEGTTGWRFVVEELERVGMQAHLAEPAETRARRARKRRAKTDRADARLLRDLLLAGNVPESWIPPAHLADLRTTVRLRSTLVAARDAWRRRVAAVLFHHGLPEGPNVLTFAGRAYAEKVELPAASRQAVDVALRMIDVIDGEVAALDAQLVRYARRQFGCQVLQRQWGIGPILAPVILAELGDTRRFSSSRQAVRFAGIDVTVSESDAHRTRGHLSRQGSPRLRWALYEAAGQAFRKASPDHDYYLEAKERLGAKRARVAVSRRILRRITHELANHGDAAFADAA